MECKAKIIERAQKFVGRLSHCREKIAELSSPFITDGAVC